jgi:hypothetical protein
MDMKNRLDIDPNGDKWLYKNGVFHSLYGPAVELNTGDKWWYLYGIHYTEKEYKRLVSNIPLLYWHQFKRSEWI